MIRDDIVVMSTREYAKMLTELTGQKKTAEAVAFDCRQGKLDAYKESERGDWKIIVKKKYVSYEEHKKLLKKYEKILAILSNINTLANEIVENN